MKNLKRILSILLVVTLVITLSACKATTNNEETSQPETLSTTEETTPSTSEETTVETTEKSTEETTKETAESTNQESSSTSMEESISTEGYDKLLTMVMDNPGVHSIIEYYGTGQIAYIQTTKSTLNFKEMGITDVEGIKAQMTEISKQYQGIDGVIQKITFTDDGMVEDVTVNYKKLDVEKAKNVIGMTIEGGNPNLGVSIEASKKLLETQGFVEQK